MKKPKKRAVSTPPAYPMNINRYLALQNYGSRRGSEELIVRRKVRINGKIAELGNRVHEGDKVEVDIASTKAMKKNYVYYAYNKARGIITHSPQGNEIDIRHEIANMKLGNISPVGRLDKDSEGLIILTNDGRITDKLLNPKFSHDKEYLVTTKKPLRSNFKERMEAGVQIESEMTAPCKVRIIAEKKFGICLTEGKKHQIRRMCVALFNEVESLKRIRIMNIDLGPLKPGQIRRIDGEELKIFLKNLGL